MRAGPILLLAAAAGLLFSCARGLDPKGEIHYAVQAQDAGMQNAASRLPGMRLVQDVSPEYWSARIAGTDLSGADWGREVVAAGKAGSLAPLGRLWGRAPVSRRLPAFCRSIVPGPAAGFIPSALYTWGLFYNRKLLDGLGVPPIRDMDGLVAALQAAKARGLVPIALGASFGWPGAAWFTYMDLRLNGGRAASERLRGARPFNDDGGRRAATLLASWRDAGYFFLEAPRAGMEESLAAVAGGRAVFVLMGAFAEQVLGGPGAAGFMEVPFWKGRGRPRGEMAGVTGFVIPAGSAKREAAVALVDAFLSAGSPGTAADGYRLPILFTPSQGADLRSVESRILAQTLWVVPSQERIMSAQFVQDSIGIWSSFFDPGSGGTGDALTDRLQSLAGKDAGR
jgi:hypothetical protein